MSWSLLLSLWCGDAAISGYRFPLFIISPPIKERWQTTERVPPFVLDGDESETYAQHFDVMQAGVVILELMPVCKHVTRANLREGHGLYSLVCGGEALRQNGPHGFTIRLGVLFHIAR